MVREIIGGSLIVLVFVIALAIFRSVRRRRIQQERLLPSIENKELTKQLFSCLYVATVFADRPLERVWAHGLGGRGRATVGLSGSYLVISRIGERSIAIPIGSIHLLSRGGATIDRGVEKGGLVQIHWNLGETGLLTSLRIISKPEDSYNKLKEAINV